MLSILTVTTITDNGNNTAPTAGSLRAAILEADAQPAGTLTTIDFKIGTGLQTIHPPDALPQITRPVVIDGTTQPGYAGVPIIDIDGTSAGSSATGLTVATTASGTATAPAALKGLEVNDFGGGGVSIQASNFNLNADYVGVGYFEMFLDLQGNGVYGVQLSGGASDDSISHSTVAATRGNGVVIAGSGTSSDTLTSDFIGTGPTGTFAPVLSGSPSNTGSGVAISGGATHIAISTSVISNNAQQGVSISGAGTEFNTLTGNFIGTDVTGTQYFGNGGGGVWVTSLASFNTIGGTSTGARNIISGNSGEGIAFSAGDSDNQVLGNYIGLDASGMRVLSDGNGISFSGSLNDTVGGSAAGAGDVISGNSYNGVWITGGSTGIVVAGDLIGPNSTGGYNTGNGMGVRIDGGAKSNTIGGTGAGARDVISDNLGIGVYISDSGTSQNVIEGDYIGTNAAGTAALLNEVNGLDIVAGASFNTVGGTTAGARDVISGNLYNGVVLTGSGTESNVVEGDYIGTDVTGAKALANGQDGVDLIGGASLNTLGGTTTNTLNVISGNIDNGVVITCAGTKSNVVEGDYIGSDVTGLNALANSQDGIQINGGATANTVGGIAPAARDVISGNTSVGVYVSGAGTSGNLVEGDFIGTDVFGTTALGNDQDGVEIFGGATANTVGGTTAGARDVISGNTSVGVYVAGAGTSGNLVEGDEIGTDVSGAKALGNDQDGVEIFGGATANTVGGTTAGARDVISGNASVGVYLSSSGTSGNLIEGDFIGTGAGGNTAVPNAINGLDIVAGATSNTVGGTTAAARDVISGNTFNGVVLAFSGTSYNLVEGDYIGTDDTGGKALANGQDGVQIVGGATANTAGGTTVGARDVISGNVYDGVALNGSGTESNIVDGDYIGTDLTGTMALANGQDGVDIYGGPSSNTVGGTTVGARDVASGNASVGVYINGSGTSGNVVEGDFIGTSAAGTAAVPNAINGLDIVSGATSNTVGGTTAAARDVISGNTFNGVVLAFSGTSYNLVEGDYIGTDDTGTKALANGQDGVDLIGGATSNIVGGVTTGTLDVISGNVGNGVLITDPGTAYNNVEGDDIGTDLTGTIAVPNTAGVLIQNTASSNIVGGPLAVYRNIISGNSQSGVVVTDPGTIGNMVRYNFVGTDVAGEHPVSNRADGVIVENGASDTYVYNDLISANGNDGVLIIGTSTNTNYLEYNSIGLDATGLKAVKEAGESYSSLTGVVIDGATNTMVESNFISGNSTGIYVGAGATTNWISDDDIGTGVDGVTNVGNLQNGVVLDGVSNNVIDYDVLVYNGNVGIQDENGATEANNLLAYDTFTITVSGVTYGNKNGAIECS